MQGTFHLSERADYGDMVMYSGTVKLTDGTMYSVDCGVTQHGDSWQLSGHDCTSGRVFSERTYTRKSSAVRALPGFAVANIAAMVADVTATFDVAAWNAATLAEKSAMLAGKTWSQVDAITSVYTATIRAQGDTRTSRFDRETPYGVKTERALAEPTEPTEAQINAALDTVRPLAARITADSPERFGLEYLGYSIDHETLTARVCLSDWRGHEYPVTTWEEYSALRPPYANN